jgi:hypothetical protein
VSRFAWDGGPGGAFQVHATFALWRRWSLFQLQNGRNRLDDLLNDKVWNSLYEARAPRSQI